MTEMQLPGVGRRDVVRGLGIGALMAVVAPAGLRAALRPREPASATAGRFLTDTELTTLRAITGRLLPGPPEDPDPGAIEAGCAEAIDALLAAFSFDPPLIHAGGPFSNRAGARRDDMARFVPLDPLAELGWRIRIEGSQGRPERSFAGEVVGLQQLYREGVGRRLHGDRSTRRIHPLGQASGQGRQHVERVHHPGRAADGDDHDQVEGRQGDADPSDVEHARHHGRHLRWVRCTLGSVVRPVQPGDEQRDGCL
ncbi:MAG TPA: hypothetical protein VJ829_12465, partial [Candidatus Binatia bacterium]|nr:hypothetical protein [Candidatus Binatia bacterium]